MIMMAKSKAPMERILSFTFLFFSKEKFVVLYKQKLIISFLVGTPVIKIKVNPMIIGVLLNL